MTAEQRDYVLYRLACADESIGDAVTLLDAGRPLRSVVNRLYYACFYAVSALLSSQGMSSSKHSGVRALFNQHWIKTGRLDPATGLFYGAMFDRRQTGDYGAHSEFDRAAVETWLEEARSFIARITTWMRENLPDLGL